MYKLLQLSTYGIKNLENEIIITFSNETIENGINKLNNIKGIFGYNGSGKSAIITSIDLYKNIICDSTFLIQNETKEKLNKLINYKKQEFYISMIYQYQKNSVLKHYIKIFKNKLTSNYYISEEGILLSTGRTLSDKYKLLILKKNEKIISDYDNKNNKLDYLSNANLEYTSIMQLVAKRVIQNKEKNFSEIEKIILYCFLCINNIEVYLLESDKHNNSKLANNVIKTLLSDYNSKNINNEIFNDIYYSDDEIIDIKSFHLYEEETKKLEKFIQIFKPDVKEIKIIKQEDFSFYHLKKLFVYENYNVELEYESSGIKQLVKLFSYLMNCAKGKIVFIDEIDTNINTIYFEKLISFFKKYGKGQLIFTTHNIESMNILKKQTKSIVVIGNDNKIDTWVAQGNKSPITDYATGAFPNSPMNIEDFDFINIFFGEE